ncbi:MAG TPA: hypothetical protein VJ783_31720 [Pirellulales bacterium]|nr:hypothetical protein [Pirellulales bacterium]
MRSTIKIMLTAAAVSLATMAVPTGDVRASERMAIRPGAQVVVNDAAASLMRGRRILATFARGQQLEVLQVAGPWVGTAVTINGRRTGGWVWRGQLTTPERFAAGPSPLRRYSYAPAQAMESPLPRSGPYPYATNVLPPDMRDYYTGGLRSGSPLIMGATRYGRNYWRADRKIIGY